MSEYMILATDKHKTGAAIKGVSEDLKIVADPKKITRFVSEEVATRALANTKVQKYADRYRFTIEPV